MLLLEKRSIRIILRKRMNFLIIIRLFLPVPRWIEPLPPLSTCEYNVHPPVPSCLDCIPGLAFCRNHERHCGDTHCIHCNFCGRLLCLAHLSCLCPSSVQGLSTGSVQGTRTLAKKPEKPENRENHEKPKTSDI